MAAGWPGSKTPLTADSIFTLFLLAVIANIVYCAAYPVDLFVQFAGLRASWARGRWAVLLTGTAFAAIIAHFVMTSLVTGGA